MRTIKELLILLDREVDGVHFESGLCLLMVDLCNHKIINRDEHRKLEAYMLRYNPVIIGMDSWYEEHLQDQSLWWEKGEKEPRHEYLNILINNCDEN